MINLDEDALICDLAETYHIYDYRSLPPRLVATLSAGLRDNSRIKMAAAKTPVPLDEILLAIIADRIEAFRYGFSSDAGKGFKRPISIYETIMGEGNNREDTVKGFATAEEFEAALARIKGE